MKKCFLLILLLAFSSSAFAQKIKVRKVKGSQAIIDFSGGSLAPGQVYELAPDEFGDTTMSQSMRRYLIAVSFDLTNTKSDAAGASNETDIAISGRFGWNYATYEFGPLASYAADATGSLTSTLFKFGGWADYNMIANTPGEIFIYGLGGLFDIGQLDNGAGSKRDIMEFFAGPFVKWFPTGSNVGFRLDGGYVYQKQSGGVASDNVVSGLAMQAGLMGYF
ncbi:hypothetical protein ACNQKP_09475 [Bdellovibrio bacteriovorus]|uniref:hypothetical protein n=1 Tax=Bdellovibrio bacteriovorus TaxID=959 RepID=UPI003AA93639